VHFFPESNQTKRKQVSANDPRFRRKGMAQLIQLLKRPDLLHS
jgi:hypothetical protein